MEVSFGTIKRAYRKVPTSKTKPSTSPSMWRI